MTTVETGLLAGRVPYIRGGSGNQQAIVFFGVNALFKRLDTVSDPARYARQVARLLPGHQITILGYSGSAFDQIARDMLPAFPTPPAVLMGISLGGLIAMRFAAQHPELVSRLVLLVSAHRFSTSGLQMVERQFTALERGDLHTLLHENALLFRRPWYNWAVRLKLWKDRNRLATGFRDPAAILRDYRQLIETDLKNNDHYCRRIASPTLVIGGTADQLFDRTAFEETARLIPSARLSLFENETHMLPVEKSNEVAAAIRNFLNAQML